MKAGLSNKTAFRVGATLPLLLPGLLLLPGCTDSYPDDLSYPLRSDPIVIKAPETPITQLDPPGHLEEWIDSLPARGGKVLDPTATIEKHQLAKINEFLNKNHFDLSEDDVREIGLASRPEKEAAKAALEARRGALQKQVDTVTSTMKDVSPKLSKVLEELFGTPAKPKVALDDPNLDEPLDDPKEFRLDPATLAEGSKLYRRHCLHCHGLSGDGRGPTGPWVNPHPRDYRQGQFKFTSSAESTGVRKARREDLIRTLKQGIEGTSMPSFALLDEDKELQPLVSYVMHLSMRGQVERDVLEAKLSGSDTDTDVADLARERLGRIWKGGWKATEKKAIQVGSAPPYASKPVGQMSPGEREQLAESIRRGFNQFTTGKAQCRTCHNDFGRANDYKYDTWGTIVRPANLTAGIYRGGRRPLDLYYRIHSGINGSAMPAFIDTTLTSEEIWDIVNFLDALPYRTMLPPDVR